MIRPTKRSMGTIKSVEGSRQSTSSADPKQVATKYRPMVRKARLTSGMTVVRSRFVWVDIIDIRGVDSTMQERWSFYEASSSRENDWRVYRITLYNNRYIVYLFPREE